MTSSPDPRQWSLPTELIDFLPNITISDDYKYHPQTLRPVHAVPSTPSILKPTPVVTPPPPGHTYPQGLVLRVRTDDRYRSRQSAYASYTPPVNPKDDIIHNARIITPPGASPARYDKDTKKFVMEPIQSMTQLVPALPVCLDLNGNPDESITVATYFDLESLRPFPEYDEIKNVSDELWNVSWGLDGKPALYELDGIKRNMRSGNPPPDCPADGSSSHGSVFLEGNGPGQGVPATQADNQEAMARRLRVAQLLSELYRLMAPLALSKLEYEVVTFRSADMNVFSFGGLFPTGVTGLQWNISSAWMGGELKTFIGLLQGSWHVDIKDDPCRWTLVVIQIRLPPGK